MIGNRDLFLDRSKADHYSFQLNHCGIQACTPGYSFRFDANPYHLIHFVLEGSGFLEADQKLVHIHAGQAFYISTGTAANYYASLTAPWKYGWIGFYSNTANPFLRLLFDDQNVIHLHMPLEEAERHLLSIISVTDNRLSGHLQYEESSWPGEQFTTIQKLSDSLIANSRMLAFFADLIRYQHDPVHSCTHLTGYQKPSFALQAKAFIDTHYQEPLKMQDVADSLHIHPNYLCCVFKKEYGQTPHDYLRSIRMAQAAMLLKLTDHPISVIAASTGYSNPFQFSTAFKAFHGLPPNAYRKKQANAMTPD